MRVRPNVTRVAAGSVAAALAMCTFTLVGTANADLPSDNVAIRPVPTQDPTADNGFQNAPFIMNNQTDKKVNDFQVVIPNKWGQGDQLRVALPQGVTFAGVPTLAVEGPTTTTSLQESAQTTVVAVDPPIASPTATVAYAAPATPTQPPTSDQNAVVLTFTNTSTAGGTGARFVLKFTDVSVNTAVTATQGALVATVSGITGPESQEPEGGVFSDVTTTLAYVSNISLSIADKPIATGNSPQTIGGITVTESQGSALIDGTYQFTFTQGPDAEPTAVTVDEPNPGGGFDAQVTGATLAEGAATKVSDNVLSLPLTGLNAGVTPLDTFTLSNIRVTSGNGGPVHVAITQVPTGSSANVTTGYQAQQNDSDDDDSNDLSRVPDARPGVEASNTVGILPRGQRIGGNDRYQTAAAVAARVADENTTTYIIASGEPGSGGVDALAANYLAGGLTDRSGAPVPILLTKKNELPDATANVLRQAFYNSNDILQVYIVGGESAVSAKVALEAQVAISNLDYPGTVQRIAGNDRYGTASGIATFLGTDAVGSYVARFGSGDQNTVFLANGAASADALSAGPISFESGFPVLLTQANALPAATIQALDSDDIGNVIILGGSDVISDGVATALRNSGRVVTRIAGDDRYATNTALYGFVTRNEGGSAVAPEGGLGYAAPQTPLIANGIGFADALTAGPLAAVGYAQGDDGVIASQPLLLSSPGKLSAATQQYLLDNRLSVTGVTAVGLGGALSQAVLIAANQAAS